jgi:MYXO-CTERM domain-containing protein
MSLPCDRRRGLVLLALALGLALPAEARGEGSACEAIWYSGPPKADCGCATPPRAPDAGLLLGLILLGLLAVRRRRRD